MKVAISRFAIVAVIAGLTALVGVPPVLAQVPNFPSGFSSGDLCPGEGCSIAVNGSTLDSGDAPWTPNVPDGTSVLRLTDAVANQRGSTWFTTAQPVTKSWNTTFQFTLSGAPATQGDGFAFVVQNNGLTALGGFGSGLGYGTRFFDPCPVEGSCVPAGSDSGIPSSLAIEFDTYQNAWDPDNQHIAIQSCGTSANSPNHSDSCFIAEASTAVPFANGLSHTVRISYTPPTCSEGSCPPTLFVYLDEATHPTPVLAAYVNIDSKLNLDGTSAYVGFTAATRGAFEAHDISAWTFIPSQTQTVSAGGDGTTFNFGDYNYTAKLNSGDDVNVQVTPVLKSQTDCNTLVQKTFAGAQCFVYNNADGLGGHFAVMFEVTCPDSPGGRCGTNADPSFDAELGSKYVFDKAFNPGYRPLPDQNPLPGWLKGQPADTVHPCNPNPSNTPGLFQSNQIESFGVVGDPIATTKGKSGGTGSCWVATYNTPNELPSVAGTIPANGANYPQGTTVLSNFSCTSVNTLIANPNSAVGPYLTVPPSVQVQDPPIPPVLGCSVSLDGAVPVALTPTTQIPTTPGSHTFVATVTDSATDAVSTQTINYNVVGPTDVAILKVGPLTAPIKSKVTYVIGLGDIGSQPAVDVNVSDLLPANTTLVAGSVSASKVSCAIVNKKLVCTTHQ